MSVAKFYLDEDVNVLLEELLLSAGHDVQSTRSAGNLGNSDETQLEFCVKSGRAMVTHNRGDFTQLAVSYFQQGALHPGVIVAVRRPVFELSLRLDQLLKQHSAETLRGQIFYV